METPNIQPGDVVKWAVPQDGAERDARYTVLELRGDRVLIQYHCTTPIRPTECVRLADVAKA